MRARRFQPSFDSLGLRLAPSTATPNFVSVDVSPTSTPPTGSMPGDDIDPTTVVGYYGSGNPPASTGDPMDPTVPVPDDSTTPSTS